MLFLVLPLGTVLYQCFFLLLSIAIEAFILRRGLRLNQRKSVEYATSINLLSITIGWLIFFIVISLFAQQVEPSVISYILFDRLFGNRYTYFWLLASIVFTFLGTSLVKFSGLYGLQLLLGEKGLPINEDAAASWKNFSLKKQVKQVTKEAKTVLWANACSSSAVVVLLLIRWSWIHQISN